MTTEELNRAYETGEELEYHLMGMEEGANLFPVPGWYPCYVDWIQPNGNVEIIFTNPDLEASGATVLKKNIPIAFRRRIEDAKAN